MVTALNADDRVAAAFLPEAAAFNVTTFGAIASRLDPGSGMYNTGPLGRATFPSYQTLNDHPLSGGNDIALLVLETNQDLSVYIDDGSGTPSHVQRRGGARVLGDAWAGDGSGDTAISDELANVGVLRIAPYGSEDVVTVDGLDVSSAPVWLPGDQAVVVLADTADGVSLVMVDAASGAQTVLVADAGDAAGGRISVDGSGTLAGDLVATHGVDLTIGSAHRTGQVPA
ncbi:MAG: hypothetical protein ACR2HR_18430 [Euzebya sp.]